MSMNISETMSTFTLVLGSHRSGSSVTTKILESLGCNLGSDLLGSDPFSNAMGHFENLHVLQYNEELLGNLGTDWKNPNPLDQNIYFTSNRVKIENEIYSLLQNLLDQKINAIKEPRISILLEAWEPAISRAVPNLKIIVTLRHPSEVATSLQKRDNLSPIIGVQLWVQATLNALRFARNHSNLFVFYDQLTTEPRDTTRGISEYLYESRNGENLTTLAAKAVVTEYRHHKVVDQDNAVLNLAIEMYEHILKFETATPQNFPDQLLGEWQSRIETTYKEVNRLELIRTTDLQRDSALEELRENSNQVAIKLTFERDQIAADRDRIVQGLTAEISHTNAERVEIASQRMQIASQRMQNAQVTTYGNDHIVTERYRIANLLTLERDKIAVDRDRIRAERRQIADDRKRIRQKITSEQNRIIQELRSSLVLSVLELDQIAAERDRIKHELTTELDQIAAERDRIKHELTTERDQIAAERDRIKHELTTERDQLLNSTIWRATKPIRWFVNLFKR